MRRFHFALSTLLGAVALHSCLAADSPAATTPSTYRTSQQIIDAAPASAWRTLDPNNTLYLELATGRVIIELAPKFAPQHAANIRMLAHDHWFDGLAIYRAQDNFVVQWGDPNAGEKNARPLAPAKDHLPAEFTAPLQGLNFHRLPDGDGYAPEVGFVDGFPVGADAKSNQAWLAHCYGTIGAGRDVAPDSSTGSELYAVIGHAPRGLDRNITVVGRVVQGMELLSVLPRGTGPLGFYEKAEQRVPIKAVELAADLPPAGKSAHGPTQLQVQVLRTDTPTWDAMVEARRNRRDAWYVRPAGYIDLCSIPIPARVVQPRPQ